MNIENFKHDDWVVYWSGDKWSPLGFSSWMSLYGRCPFSQQIDIFVNQSIAVWDSEATTCYIRSSENKIFGEKVAAQIIKNPAYVDYICDGFKSGTDLILSIYRKNQTEFSYEEYEHYNAAFLSEYYVFHLQDKNVVDYLPPKLLEIYLPKLQKARVYAEPVFSEEIDFMKRIAQFIGKKSGYDPEDILFCTVDELTAYWRDNLSLPSKDILAERRQSSVFFFEGNKIQIILAGKDITQFNVVFVIDNNIDTFKGQIAFPGKTSGVARIVFDPLNVKEFNDGDILVASWTRPEYLPIMNRAGAFITDGGGILSHAAIVAREMKKPCIIGTKIATKVLKDGDMVEVDAEKGVVRKI